MVEGVTVGIIIILTEHVRIGKIKESIMLGKLRKRLGFFVFYSLIPRAGQILLLSELK